MNNTLAKKLAINGPDKKITKIEKAKTIVGFEKEKEKPIEVQIDVTDRYKHGEDRTYIDNNAHFLSRKCIGRCFRLKHGETYEERETDCPRCNGNKDWY